MNSFKMNSKKTLLLVTDFYYQAKGREYFREDIELSEFLRKYFHVCISHIQDCGKVLPSVDAVLIRNSGPQMFHQKELDDLRNRKELLLYNDLSGKGDIKGKAHLLELYHLGYPVIPTVDSIEKVHLLGTPERYLLKPLNGADSAGVRILKANELRNAAIHQTLIQPVIDFQYEVSFYFVDQHFHYAFHAPDVNKRWELKTYNASKEDVEFAKKFIDWNTCKFGIQRVDACRTQDGRLLLMELEDYNPFLSLDLLQKDVKERFLKDLCDSLSAVIAKRTP